MLLNHPPGVPRMGKVALATLETMEPTPIEIIMVPRVTMKGGIFRRETRSPLKRPKARPTTMIRRREGTMGKPCLSAVPPMMAAAIMTVPMERSIPPRDDDEGDAHRDEADVVGGVDDVHQGGVGEVVAPEDAEEDVEDDQRRRGKRPLQSALAETLHPTDFVSRRSPCWSTPAQNCLVPHGGVLHDGFLAGLLDR